MPGSNISKRIIEFTCFKKIDAEEKNTIFKKNYLEINLHQELYRTNGHLDTIKLDGKDVTVCLSDGEKHENAVEHLSLTEVLPVDELES